MNGKTITDGDIVVSVSMVLLYTTSLKSSVLYTVTVYPVISPLGWVGGSQTMFIFSMCILVPGSKVDELSLNVAARSSTGPGSKREDREKEAIYIQYGECREGKERREGGPAERSTHQLQVIGQ